MHTGSAQELADKSRRALQRGRAGVRARVHDAASWQRLRRRSRAVIRMREYLADFVPMAIVGLVVANVAYAVGAWPLVSELAGVVAAISVYYGARKWRSRAGEAG